jgi:hypothetical protein
LETYHGALVIKRRSRQDIVENVSLAFCSTRIIYFSFAPVTVRRNRLWTLQIKFIACLNIVMISTKRYGAVLELIVKNFMFLFSCTPKNYSAHIING